MSNLNSDVHYTINVCNTNSKTETYLSYSSTNLSDLLDKGSDYDLYVQRVRFPSASIPLRKRFRDDIYSLSLNVDVGLVGYTQYLSNNDAYNGTSFLYSYQNYCDMINGAFVRAFTALKTAYSDSVSSTLPPIMKYNPVTQFFSIIFPITYLTDKIHIYFNNPLQWLFNFDSIRTTIDPQDPFPANPLYPPINDYQLILNGYQIYDVTYYSRSQYYNTTSILTDFKSFLLTTGMSISPLKHGTSLNGVVKNNDAFNMALAEIEIGSVSQSGQVIWEINNPVYHRIIDPTNLKQIDLQFFYTDTSDNIYKLPFELNFSASVEVVFRKVFHRVTSN